MKIKTITCHNVYNHGATLQAYALVAYLEKLGHDVEIIDYLPPYLRIRTNFLSVSSNWIDRPWFWKLAYLVGKIPSRLLWPFISCKKRFDSFNKKNLSVTTRRYRTYRQLCKNPPSADLYLAGSDQIWNTSYQNGRDPAFFLDFGPDSIRRASYAASFGLGNVVEQFIPFVKQKLGRFNKISVREKNGMEIIRSLGFEGDHVCDPVFLLDEKDWDKICEEAVQPDEPYILIYDFEGREEFRSLAEELAKKLSLPLYSINNYHRCSYADRDFYTSGPDDFLSLIKNAELVVSNSFHATAFAIIFGTKFFALPRLNDKVNSRMESLLASCGLQDRFLQDYWAHDVAALVPLRPILCAEGYEEMVCRSKEYLKGLLG
jgi:polysaccharide pyruvyl transferase WcaK-like protein